MKRKVVVAGALGIVGRAALDRLVADGADVIGLSRRSVLEPTGAEMLAVDLEDRADVAAKLGGVTGITHIFHTAYAPAATLAEEARRNTRMLVNLVETVEAASGRTLRHVQLMQGSKWYGNHLGPYRTPAREDDPRHAAACFYYDQQDWLAARQMGRGWSWSALRPHGLLGFALGSPMNQLTALALYAAISKELGLPLRWPGTQAAFDCVYQFTEAPWLARGMVWAADTPAAQNRAFNFTNGDYVRWRHVWPKLAAAFGIEVGGVQTVALAEVMADKEPLWAQMRARYDLAPHTLATLTNWGFADFVFRSGFDQMSDTTAARLAGWTGVNPSEDAYLRQISGLRARRIIP